MATLVALACRGAAPTPPIPDATGLPVVSPAAAGFDAPALAQVVEYLRVEVDSGSFPGAVVAVGRPGRLALLAAVGRYAADDTWPVDPATIYDLASLTKVVGLTTATLLLTAEGRLTMDDPVRRWVPAFRGQNKDRVTIRHLLTHSSGLPAWVRCSGTRRRGTRRSPWSTRSPLRAPGDTFVYSDLGAILLTQVTSARRECRSTGSSRSVFERWG
jgi:CubicO group peptidase (beta-lactamase class C family)